MNKDYKHYKCVCLRSKTVVPIGAHVEIISKYLPSDSHIKSAIFRKYGVDIRKEDIKMDIWDVKQTN